MRSFVHNLIVRQWRSRTQKLISVLSQSLSLPVALMTSECGGVGGGAGSDQDEKLGLRLEGREHS